jgi:dTDP-4-dehydrorhamnose reductase
MPTKIVVLGATGMLGHKIFQRLRVAFPGTVAIMRKRADRPPFKDTELLQGADVLTGIDVMDCEARVALSEIRPNYLINCAGIIKQRDDAHEFIPSITINALLPHRLAELAASWHGQLIHFSTDCVFSGARGNYTEEDQSDAQDLYGRSKFLGETAGPNALTLRTSMIGRELTGHRSLLDWFRAQAGKTIQGYRRVIYSGVTTNHLADVVTHIIRNHSDLHGLYQVAGSPITKYDLLCLLRDAYRLNVQITPNDTEQSDRSMSGEKLYRAIGYRAPPWPELIHQLATDSTPYESWYSHEALTRKTRPDHGRHRLPRQDSGQEAAAR